MTEPTPAVEAAPEPVREPVTAPAPTPDPAIAPGVDPDADASLAVQVEDRWVRFEGQVAATVEHIGEWLPGEAKHVTGWLAARLLAHAHFVAAEPPADEMAPAPATAPAAMEAAPVADTKTRRKPTSADDTAA